MYIIYIYKKGEKSLFFLFNEQEKGAKERKQNKKRKKKETKKKKRKEKEEKRNEMLKREQAKT